MPTTEMKTSFTVPADDVYFVTLSGAADSESTLHFRLKKDGQSTFDAVVPGADPEVPITLRRDSVNHGGPDIMARSAIVRYTKGHQTIRGQRRQQVSQRW